MLFNPSIHDSDVEEEDDDGKPKLVGEEDFALVYQSEEVVTSNITIVHY